MFAPRFNFIDASVMCFATLALTNGQWLLWLAVNLIGLPISLYGRCREHGA